MVGTEFRGTLCFAQKWAQWAKNSGFFEKKKFFFWKYCKMKHCHLYITAKPLSVKCCFSSYVSKCCWPIRLQDSLKCNLKKEVKDKVDFLYVNRQFLQGDT